jgi:hypothetical protein
MPVQQKKNPRAAPMTAAQQRIAALEAEIAGLKRSFMHHTLNQPPQKKCPPRHCSDKYM